MYCSFLLEIHQGEARRRQGQAGVPSDARRVGVVQRRDWGGGEQRRHQDEHRHGHAVGLLGGAQELL